MHDATAKDAHTALRDRGASERETVTRRSHSLMLRYLVRRIKMMHVTQLRAWCTQPPHPGHRETGLLIVAQMPMPDDAEVAIGAASGWPDLGENMRETTSTNRAGTRLIFAIEPALEARFCVRT